MYWGDKIKKLYGFQETFESKDFINLCKGSLYFYIFIYVIYECNFVNYCWNGFLGQTVKIISGL